MALAITSHLQFGYSPFTWGVFNSQTLTHTLTDTFIYTFIWLWICLYSGVNVCVCMGLCSYEYVRVWMVFKFGYHCCFIHIAISRETLSQRVYTQWLLINSIVIKVQKWRKESGNIFITRFIQYIVFTFLWLELEAINFTLESASLVEKEM